MFYKGSKIYLFMSWIVKKGTVSEQVNSKKNPKNRESQTKLYLLGKSSKISVILDILFWFYETNSYNYLVNFFSEIKI